MKPLVGWALLGAMAIAPLPARAGEVKVSFDHGLVTVVAVDASPREILGEWARLGQVRVVNLDRLSAAPVTLQITEVPEIKALEVILRGTAGYVAAPRRAGTDTQSQYDRILLMPGMAPAVPAAAASRPATPGVAAGRGGFGGPAVGEFGGPMFGRAGSMRAGAQGQGSQSFVMPEPAAGEDEEAQPAMPGLPAAAFPGAQAGATQSPVTSPLGASRPGEVVGPDVLSIRNKYGPGVQAPATLPGAGVTPYGLPNPTVKTPGQPASGPIKNPE